MASEVLDELGRRIADGDLAPGAVFTFAEVESRFGVARSVAREAVSVLTSIGMVEPRRRVGIIVRESRFWDVYDADLIRWTLAGSGREAHLQALMELRLAAEPLAARLAAERATPEERAELVRSAEMLDQVGHAGRGHSLDYLDADVDFHTTLLAASGNPFLAALAGPISEVLRGRARHGLTPARPAPGTLEDHVATARAIADHDPVAAARHSAAQLEQVRREVETE